MCLPLYGPKVDTIVIQIGKKNIFHTRIRWFLLLEVIVYANDITSHKPSICVDT